MTCLIKAPSLLQAGEGAFIVFRNAGQDLDGVLLGIAECAALPCSWLCPATLNFDVVW